MMHDTVDQVRAACLRLSARLATDAGLIHTEADAQAELHAELLEVLSEPLTIHPGDGLLQHSHHTWPLRGVRAYREISAGPSRATTRSDILLLREEPQFLMPKIGGAPARFAGPAAAVIEVKLDLGRSSGANISPAILRDFIKWREMVSSEQADHAITVVFTDRPSSYDAHASDGVIVVPMGAVVDASCGVDVHRARDAMESELASLATEHRARPLSMLREKDFETALLRALRTRFAGQASSIRSQHAVRCGRSGSRRPLDVAILSPDSTKISAAVELKTSHSAKFKTLGRPQLEEEADFLSGLVADELCGAAFVAVFRYGSRAEADDVTSFAQRWPALPLTYADC